SAGRSPGRPESHPGRWLATASARRTMIWPGAVGPDWTIRALVLVLGGEQQRGERLEGGHELVELVRLEALVGPRREVVGERLDPLSDGAARFAQPAVIPDQAAIAHPVDHGGELRCREVVDASELRRWHAHAEGEQDVSLKAADTLGHQGRDV